MSREWASEGVSVKTIEPNMADRLQKLCREDNNLMQRAVSCKLYFSKARTQVRCEKVYAKRHAAGNQCPQEDSEGWIQVQKKVQVAGIKNIHLKKRT